MYFLLLIPYGFCERKLMKQEGEDYKKSFKSNLSFQFEYARVGVILHITYLKIYLITKLNLLHFKDQTLKLGSF